MFRLLKKNLFYILISLFIFSSCGDKEKTENKDINLKEFTWKTELKISDIPDSPLRGFINGKEIKIEYINFEKWRGSGDNVLNFGDVKPKNNCGYIESGTTIHFMHKSGEIVTGEILKASFEQKLDGYIAYYDTLKSSALEMKSGVDWNCALIVSEIGDSTLKGKIAICFKDEAKSWIAGKFEAVRCNN